MPRRKQGSSASHGSESDFRKFIRNMYLTAVGITLVMIEWFGIGMGGQLALIIVAMALSQCSMVVIWSSGFRGSPIISYAVVTVSAVLMWHVINRVDFIGFGDAAAASSEIVVLTQILVTLAGTKLLGTLSKTSRRENSRRSVRKGKRKTLSMSIGTRILGMGIAAVGLLAVHIMMRLNEWSWGAMTVDQSLIAAAMGVSGAAIAIIWLTIFRRAVWWKVGARAIAWLPVFFGIPTAFYWIVSYPNPMTAVDALNTTLPLSAQVVLDGLTLLVTLNHTRR